MLPILSGDMIWLPRLCPTDEIYVIIGCKSRVATSGSPTFFMFGVCVTGRLVWVGELSKP